jgi:uncharacterized glyoxalase superfamily protein PhnB
MPEWFARPVLQVTNVDAALAFYIERLGFTSSWCFGEGGRSYVAQVDRDGCAIILTNTFPEAVGRGLLFVSLNVEPPTHQTAVAALDALRAEFEGRGAKVEEGSWGYRVLIIQDLDGNRLFFNYPNEDVT